jgi:methyltransferase-like protein
MLKNQTQAEAFEYFKKNLTLNDTIYCIIRHVSKSGMTRHIAFFDIKDNQTSFLNTRIADLLGYKMNKHHDALVVGGCGMDMAFSVVNNLQETMNSTSFAVYKLSHRIL